MLVVSYETRAPGRADAPLTGCSRGFPEDLRPAADVRGAASGVTEGGFPLGRWASSQSDIPLLEMCPVDLPRNSEGHVQEGCPKCICIFTTRNRNDRGVAVTLTHAPVPTVRMPAHLPRASSAGDAECDPEPDRRSLSSESPGG